MQRTIRRTAPKVRDGKVQNKNRWDWSTNYTNCRQPTLVYDRRNPGAGYRHLVRPADVKQFVESLPEWNVLREGLDAVVLAEGDPDCLGWHRTGVVALNAWERDYVLTGRYSCFFAEHYKLLEKLNVPCSQTEGSWVLEFTEATARAFHLVHVLVHELGHHHDRITTRSKRQPCRGESYAEEYAVKHEDEVLELYWSIFPDDY